MATQPTPVHPATLQAQMEASSPSRTATNPAPILTTRRLIVRPMCLEDAPSASLNANNPLIAKYMSLGFPSPYTLAKAEEWINMNMALPYQEAFVICEHSSPGVVIGGVGIKVGTDVNAHTGEVGYWMGQDYWGRGYTTEMLEAFTKWVFENWERDGQRLRRLCGGVFSGNVASMRCFEKCGYGREGVMKGHCEKNGEVMDMHLFGLIKRDWEDRMSEVFNNY